MIHTRVPALFSYLLGALIWASILFAAYEVVVKWIAYLAQ